MTILRLRTQIFALQSLCVIINFLPAYSVKSKHLIKIGDENWRDILKGEWMINVYSKAAWCPACKEIERPWNAFADWSGMKKQRVKVAQVDISENPGLSGRFLVTALPTIYHVKDGVFRMYNGEKDKEDFIKFVRQKQWSSVEKTPSWCYPDSFQMSVVSALFKFSMQTRAFHNHLVDKKGLPSLLSFGIFAAVTLTVGCILGFLMVLIIDHFVPKARNPRKEPTISSKINSLQQRSEKNRVNSSRAGADKHNKNSSLLNGYADKEKVEVRQRKSDGDKEATSNPAQVKSTKNVAADKKE